MTANASSVKAAALVIAAMLAVAIGGYEARGQDWAATTVEADDTPEAAAPVPRPATSRPRAVRREVVREQQKPAAPQTRLPVATEVAAKKSDDAEPAALLRPLTNIDDRHVEAACSIFVDSAARTAIEAERKSLEKMAEEIARQATALDEKTRTLQEWLQNREMLVVRINKFVVDTYARMKPEAAAVQLATMIPGHAGAILSRIDPARASAIVSEMEPAKAGAILAILTAAVADTTQETGGR